MKFLSCEVPPYLRKSIIWPCMGYCCHVCTGAPSCFLELLGKLQKWICRTVGSLLAAPLQPLIHCQDVASVKFVSTAFLLVYFLGLKESTCKTSKTDFYFTSLFLKKIKF